MEYPSKHVLVVNLEALVTHCNDLRLYVTLAGCQLFAWALELAKELPPIGEDAQTVRPMRSALNLEQHAAMLLGKDRALPLNARF
jgi:hypothetical protein